jgi:hypothetical protein
MHSETTGQATNWTKTLLLKRLQKCAGRYVKVKSSSAKVLAARHAGKNQTGLLGKGES